MTHLDSVIYICVCLLVLALCIKPVGKYMARVYSGKKMRVHNVLGWLETAIYKSCGINPDTDMSWRNYATVILVFNAAGFLLLFTILNLQGVLPLNPQGLPSLPADLAFNTAISFITNTNWQNYAGEMTLSYFSQMVGLAVQNFLSAATGMSVAVALIRGLAGRQTQTIGNAYADMVRSVVYILLPIAFIFALIFVSQGVIQNLNDYISFTSVFSGESYQIAQGPVASQLAIKMLGGNGGGFFGANSAHPFENPTPLTNMIEILLMLLMPASFFYMFGIMAGDRRQGIALLAVNLIITLPLLAFAVLQETGPNPWAPAHAVDMSAGNMEGKEVRFGPTSSALWAVATTTTSNGSVNSMHSSYMPLGGLVPLMLIQFEVLLGGVGSGLYGMLMFVLLTVFIAGLMVGRTPEYLGKKLGAFEIKMASVVMVMPGALMLAGTAIAVATEAGRAGAYNPGAHAFSEILYAFASASNNNGSAFASLQGNNPFYNNALAVVMFLGRFWLIIPVLAIAGSLAQAKTVPANAGTLGTHTILFTLMLCFVILLNLLTYLPSLALGPIADHLRLLQLARGGL